MLDIKRKWWIFITLVCFKCRLHIVLGLIQISTDLPKFSLWTIFFPFLLSRLVSRSSSIFCIIFAFPPHNSFRKLWSDECDKTVLNLYSVSIDPIDKIYMISSTFFCYFFFTFLFFFEGLDRYNMLNQIDSFTLFSVF